LPREPKTPDVNQLLLKKDHSFNMRSKKVQRTTSVGSTNSPGKPRRMLLLENMRNALNNYQCKPILKKIEEPIVVCEDSESESADDNLIDQ
jgi:hypothetical protein